MSDKIWRQKLSAWLHDPAEKAFVLLQDPAGHTGGTVRTLRKDLGLGDEDDLVKRADWWASAADRPQWPRNADDGRFAPWTQVEFAKQPVLIHPLTGAGFDLKTLSEIDFKQVKAVSLEHFRKLLELGGSDLRMKFLALWRFGPEVGVKGFEALWQQLPADTRVPDHTIWNHLDTVSAFAGAFEDGECPALLSMSIGPVQSFIAQSRSTSDLWAGSHLLSSLVWEAMKPIAAELGPDAFLFPQVRGLPIVDSWLLELAEKAGLGKEWKVRFKGEAWMEKATDGNPLFAACLPNKLLALVPRSKAGDLARQAREAVRGSAMQWAEEAARFLFDSNEGHHARQIEAQLADFPRIHWAAADWPSTLKGDAANRLSEAYNSFVETDSPENFFRQPVWETLNKEVCFEGLKFYDPNPGILYPAVFSLAERALSAAKTVQPFGQLSQKGFRCTLCGEREWLADSPDQLEWAPGQRIRNETRWTGKAGTNGIKKGEHLCAVCALKRFWPRLFTDRVGRIIETGKLPRFVVSTHTMALATTLDSLIDRQMGAESLGKLLDLVDRYDVEPVALPAKLFKKAFKANSPRLSDSVKKLPAILDSLKDSGTQESEKEIAGIKKILHGYSVGGIENYYALLLMDGDNMGAWLAGNEKKYQIPFRASWHPQVEKVTREQQARFPLLGAYLDSYRPPSPGRHSAISQALNSFSSILAPFILEETVNGKLLYSGGDDVLAMVSTGDLLDAMTRLRLAYGGISGELGPGSENLRLGGGFARLRGRLMRVMGEKATASIGAVVVHHQTPLAIALESLREAERQAKLFGRDAFCLRILKRGGGEVSFTDSWWANGDGVIPSEEIRRNSGLGVLKMVVAELSKHEELSRRVVYASSEWLKDVPPQAANDAGQSKEMAAALLAQQFSRHGGEPELARKLVEVLWGEKPGNPAVRFEPRDRLTDLLFVAEFLARETRSGSPKRAKEESK